MTPTEFVIWFQGFAQAANTYNITPKQWDSICEHLEMVKLEKDKNHTIKYDIKKTNSTY